MNLVQTASGVVALIATIGGGVYAFESRMELKYVQISEYQDFQWAYLKDQLRRLRDELKKNPNDERTQKDLEEMLDLFCRRYPTDRECVTATAQLKLNEVNNYGA